MPNIDSANGEQAGGISRRRFLQGVAAVSLTAGGLQYFSRFGGVQAVEAQTAPKYLVVLVLDAFRPDYQQLAPMPNLAALQAAGTTYDRAWVGQLESETPVGHASIGTGSFPRNDGVIGFEWADPKRKGEILDGWPAGVLAGKLEADMKASGASSIAGAVKAANPAAKIVSISSEKVYAADAMGGWAADYILYHKRNGTSGPLTPTALAQHQPPADFFQHPHLTAQQPMKHFTDWDYLSGVLALAAIEQFRPTVLMVNFPGADVYGHPYGGPAAPGIFAQVAAGIDRNIGRIIAAYKQAGIYDQTLFVVTADHGMVPNDRAVDGSVTKATVRSAGGQYIFHTGGTAADIYLHNDWHAKAVAQAMLEVPNVAASYYRVASKGAYTYEQAPGMRIDPALDAAYQYLLQTFAGPTSPDVVAPFRENTIGTLSKTAHGDHGGLNWGAQHIPLVLSGPGVRSGIVSHYPARLIDIAPTVLRLLGLSQPKMDGVVLADSLIVPLQNDTAAQASLTIPLTGYQNALMLQSTDNIEEDEKDDIKPPKPLPARP